MHELSAHEEPAGGGQEQLLVNKGAATAERGARAPEVDVDGGGGGHVGGVAVDGERPRVEDGEVGRAELGQLVDGRPDEHVVHEQRVVGARAHHAHLDPRLRTRTR